MDHKIELMEQAQKSAVGPEMLPNEILRSVGCCALRDLGGMAWVSSSLLLYASLEHKNILMHPGFFLNRELALAPFSSHSTFSLSYSRQQHLS